MTVLGGGNTGGRVVVRELLRPRGRRHPIFAQPCKKMLKRGAPWLHDIPLICSTMKRGENVKFGENRGGTKSSEIFGIWIS